MIIRCVALVAVMFAVGCASRTHRMPSSMPTTLAEKYQDTIVAYCSPSKVVVFHDVNRCGLATSRSRACTEMASYTSDMLTVVEDGATHSYMNAEGTELFRLVSMKNGDFELSSSQGLFKRPEVLKDDRLDPHFFNNLCR